MKEQELDQLFKSVRESRVEIPLDQTRRRFLKSVGVGALGSFLVLKFYKLISLKLSIMILGMSTFATVIFFAVAPAKTEVKHPATPAKAMVVQSDSVNEETTEEKHVPMSVKMATVPSDSANEEITEITFYSPEHKVVKHIRKTTHERTETNDINTLDSNHLISENQIDKLLSIVRSTKDSIPEATHEKTFVLTRNMEDADLAEIERQATAAGIDFHYSILVWKGLVKRCKISMNFVSPSGASCNYKSELTGKFNKTIGWIENSEGKVVALID